MAQPLKSLTLLILIRNFPAPPYASLITVPEVGLEPTTREGAGFESAVYTIPPLRPLGIIS